MDRSAPLPRYAGASVSIHEFMRIIKFGRMSGPSLREVTLGLVMKAAERCGMTLGEVKVLLFVAALVSERAYCIGRYGPKSGKIWERLHLLLTISRVALCLRRRIL